MKVDSLNYIFLLTVCVYLHSNFSGGCRNFQQDFCISKKGAFQQFKAIQGR